jgi:hypothetical protein
VTQSGNAHRLAAGEFWGRHLRPRTGGRNDGEGLWCAQCVAIRRDAFADIGRDARAAHAGRRGIEAERAAYPCGDCGALNRSDVVVLGNSGQHRRFANHDIRVFDVGRRRWHVVGRDVVQFHRDRTEQYQRVGADVREHGAGLAGMSVPGLREERRRNECRERRCRVVGCAERSGQADGLDGRLDLVTGFARLGGISDDRRLSGDV